MRNQALPIAVFAGAVIAAVSVIVGGIVAAKEQRLEIRDHDETPVEEFARHLQAEILSLEKKYEAHLAAITSKENTASAFEIRANARDIWGIRIVSLLPVSGERDSSEHVTVTTMESGQRILPTFQDDEAEAHPDWILLRRENLGEGWIGESGWLDQAGTPLMFWNHISDQMTAVATVDRDSVAERIDFHLREQWLDEHIFSLRVEGGPVHRILRGQRVLARTTETLPEQSHEDAPDRVYLAQGRFGSWHIRSWDRRETVVAYHSGIVIGAAVVASAIVLLGWFASQKMRHAIRLAEQRVSFVNHVSHELRAPLTNIILNADLTRDHCEPPGRKRLGVLQDEAMRLKRLIDNLLTFSRHSARKIPPSRVAASQLCRPTEIVTETVQQFRPSLDRCRISHEIECAEDLEITTDPDTVKQIVGNLISNVEKYAGRACHLKIEVSRPATGEEKNHISLRVSDNGPGVTDAQARKLFRPFYRTSDRVSEGGTGTGLGLTISRELAESLGGSLSLLRHRDGMVFELILPDLRAHR